MDFEAGTSETNNPKLEEMYENLTSITKQLAILQGFIESKYGHEFTSFCQFSEASSVDPAYTPGLDSASVQEDTEDYDKMPNLVSEDNPSRTLGFVTVPLRQTTSGGGGSSNKLQSPVQSSSSSSYSGSGSKRDRCNIVKEENALETENDHDDMMYPLHNLSDLLEGAGEVDTNETPEFLELELDPSTLLRGEPPALQPMFANNNHGHGLQQQQCSINNNNNSTGHNSKRSTSRQSNSNFHRYDVDAIRGNSNVTVTRRASVGSPENSVSYKKFDCHVCGIKFEFAETLKSHLESHAGARNIRSSSDDQSALGSSLNAIPLPRLMPRPSITAAGAVPMDMDMDMDEPTVIPTKVSKSHKKSSAQISASPTSSSITTSKLAALKRRKRYNQSRPCALKCPECNLPIRDKSRLIEHLRGHTGERPFECSVCSKAYTRRDVLKTHMIKMHGITPADYLPS